MPQRLGATTARITNGSIFHNGSAKAFHISPTKTFSRDAQVIPYLRPRLIQRCTLFGDNILRPRHDTLPILPIPIPVILMGIGID